MKIHEDIADIDTECLRPGKELKRWLSSNPGYFGPKLMQWCLDRSVSVRIYF
jgi:hypothetical protein